MHRKHAEAIERPRELTEKSLLLLKRNRQRRFQTGTGPGGKKWKRKSPLTMMTTGQSVALTLTGLLRESMAIRIDGDDKGAVGSSDFRALVHHEGRTIKPVRAKMLAIPVTREAAMVTSPRKIAGLFSPKGKRVLARSDGSGGLEILFILKSQVKIPERKIFGTDKREEKQLKEISKEHLKDNI